RSVRPPSSGGDRQRKAPSLSCVARESPLALLTSTPTTHDELVARLVRTTGADFLLTPGGHRVAATRGAAFTTTVGVVDRVHRHTADGRALALPAVATSLPQLMLPCSELPTSPTVARQRASTLRISPEGIRNCAYGPSFATSCTDAPAERAIFAPPPGRSSIACTNVPVGMLRSGRLLPGLMSAEGPASTRSPCLRRFGARM